MSQQRLDEIAEVLQVADTQMRVELLLDYARQLPALPPRLRAQREAGLNRVPECMTPVFLWIEPAEATAPSTAPSSASPAPGGLTEGGPHLRLFIDVAEEAPTVRGLLSIIVHAYDRDTAAEITELPLDLLQRLGLSDVLRMNRVVGLSAILSRIRRGAEAYLPI